MTRKSILSLAIAASMMLAGSALAQDQQPAQQPDTQQPAQQGTEGHAHKGMRGQRGEMMMDPQAQLDHMSKELNLTDDQKAKIQPILEDTQKQMEGVRNDSSLSQQDRMTKVREIHQNAMSQVEPILTAEQRTKLEKMQQNRREHMGARRRGNKGAAPQSQPQPQQ
jgi:periplasmic protein CpxP/Spy